LLQYLISGIKKKAVRHVANIKSQIKRIKTNEKAQIRNKSVRSSLKTAVRRFRDVVTTGDSAQVAQELRAASKALDIAVSKGVLHANAAANKKSAMAKAANKSSAK
jgi:small subunit ribosomal protein S20